MKLPRRAFIQTGVLAGLAAGLPKNILGFVSEGEAFAPGVRPSLFEPNTFSSLVGTRFRIMTGKSGSAEMKLDGVEVHPSTTRRLRAPECNGFSVFFSADPGTLPGQGTYTVEHSALGRFALFVVPVGAAGITQTYEAVFNHLA